MSPVNETNHRLVCSVRFWLSILCFFLNAIHFMQRVNLSVAIVSMVSDRKNSSYDKNNETIDHLNENFETNSFNWNKNLQGILLSSIFIGPFFTQIIGGWISLIIGPKIILFASVLISSILTVITPFSASLSFYALLAVRTLIGLSQGVVTSSLNLLWAHWAPPQERSTLLAISNSGSLIGNALTFLVGGFLCAGNFLGGWPSIFYLSGFFGIFWCFIWIFAVSDFPNKHKWISVEESNYIMEKTADENLKEDQKKNVPWKKIFTSKSVLCLIVSSLCGNFGISLFTTCLPTYMKEVLDFDIKLNGELSSIPFISCWIFIIFSGVLSDILTRSKKIKKIHVRKLCNSIGFMIPAFTFIVLIFADSSQKALCFIMILINISFSGFQYGSGYLVNFNDIGGVFSGIIYGVANTIGNLTAFLAPFLVGIITKNRSKEEWQIVFLITLIVYILGAFVFVLFARGETEVWAKNANKELDELEQKE